jgi:hypothetical protein
MKEIKAMGIYIEIPTDLIDQFEAASIIGVSSSTLKTWRSRNPDLGYYQGFGREIRYSRAECEEYRRKAYKRIVPSPRSSGPAESFA